MWDPGLSQKLREHAWRGGSGQPTQLDPGEGFLHYYCLKNYLICVYKYFVDLCVYVLLEGVLQKPEKNVESPAVGILMVVNHRVGARKW